MNYYNDNDPHAAAWLLGLIEDGLIPKGHVDARSITDVQPADLVGYVQCHFFAGIGGWPLSLRIAGWPEYRECWTASCPCQPFSNSGKQQGESDSRHLWPEFSRLVRACKPPVTFGEQVSSKLGRVWLSRVRSDLEGMGYGVGAADLCSASIGSPNIRQRLYWLAQSQCRDAERQRFHLGISKETAEAEAHQRERIRPDSGSGIVSGRLADHGSSEWRPCIERGLDVVNRDNRGRQEEASGLELHQSVDGMDDSSRQGLARAAGQKLHWRVERSSVECTVGVAQPLGDTNDKGLEGRSERPERAGELAAGPSGAWSQFDIVGCRDGKSRRIPQGSLESGLQCMAHGLPIGMADLWHQGYPLAWEKIESRPSLLKGIGNAINPYVAAEFVKAYMECTEP